MKATRTTLIELGEVLVAFGQEHPTEWSMYRPTPWAVQVWVEGSSSGIWHTYWLSSRHRARALKTALEDAGFECQLVKN